MSGGMCLSTSIRRSQKCNGGSSVLLRAQRAEKPTTAVVRRQHQVTYFRNRDEYQNTLRPMQPQIGITLGIYFAGLARPTSLLTTSSTKELCCTKPHISSFKRRGPPGETLAQRPTFRSSKPSLVIWNR